MLVFQTNPRAAFYLTFNGTILVVQIFSCEIPMLSPSPMNQVVSFLDHLVPKAEPIQLSTLPFYLNNVRKTEDFVRVIKVSTDLQILFKVGH